MIFGPADKKHPAGKYRTKRGGVLYALNIIYGGLSGDCPRTSAGKRLCPLRRYFQPYERDEAFCEPAVKELSKKNYLVKKDDGTLSLTETGKRIALQIYEKHRFFTRQLIEAGVSPDIAAQDACKLEHVISEVSFSKLKAAVKQNEEVVVSDKSSS